jgi:hypothetical protein
MTSEDSYITGVWQVSEQYERGERREKARRKEPQSRRKGKPSMSRQAICPRNHRNCGFGSHVWMMGGYAIGLGVGTQALTLSAVVSSTTLKPGESGMLRIALMMHEGMGGPHNFRITVKTNDAISPETVLTVKAVFGP